MSTAIDIRGLPVGNAIRWRYLTFAFRDCSASARAMVPGRPGLGSVTNPVRFSQCLIKPSDTGGEFAAAPTTGGKNGLCGPEDPLSSQIPGEFHANMKR